jgi:MoxR-like ATPase
VSDPMTPARAAEALRRIRAVVGERIFGQEQVIDQALVSFIARGHALLEGVPGTAKTLLVRAIAGALGLDFKRIQFTPDLMPADITGISVMRDASRGFEFQPGPIFTDLLLGDEINRAPAKTQSALLEAMAERQTTVDGNSRSLGEMFTVFATQNPVEYEGTYPLPEAQLDRFLLKIVVPYPSKDAELRMLTNYSEGFDAERVSDAIPGPVVSREECESLRRAASAVLVAPDIREYIAEIVRATRSDSRIMLGGSPRSSVALFRSSRASALLGGRDYVTPDDVKDMSAPVLRHRLRLSPELEVEGTQTDSILDEILRRIPVPK